MISGQQIFVTLGAVILVVIGVWAFMAPPPTPKQVQNEPQNNQVTNANKDDLIWVASPLPEQEVASPLTVAGFARGNWYFEASFPIKLLDGNGKMLLETFAQAQGEWMTTSYVPFSKTLVFLAPTTVDGTLVLEKDNPSGLPENANELRIPIRFEAAK